MSVVFKELSRFKWKLLCIALCMFVSTFATMGIPALMSYLVDKSIPTNNIPQVLFVTGLMLAAVIIALLMGVVVSNIAAKVSMGVSKNLRSKVFLKVIHMNQEEVDRFSVSSLISRTNNDIQNIQIFLSTGMVISFMGPIMCIVGCIMAISTSARLSNILIIAVPLMVIIIIIIGKTSQPISIRIQKLLDKINLIIREKLTGTRVIRAFGATDFEAERFDAVNVGYSRGNKKMMRKLALYNPIVMIILALTTGYILFKACNSTLFWEFQFSVGEVMALVSYIIYIMVSVIMMSVVFLLWPRASASALRVKEVLFSKSRITNPVKPKDNNDNHGCLEFKNVTFKYTGAEKPAIKDLSFKAYPGEITAIIGGTGMGKSTIINMIPRLYDATGGQILVDGVDVKEYDLSVLRSKIGFVPQKACLFKGTISSNIKFGGIDPTEQAVEEAIEIAQSTDFVMSKEKQYEEPVSQGGSNFSGGQKQRLCIARAIVDEPEIYIFDDSFSALDFKTDKALRSALKAKTKNATTVIVAQRVSTIMDADRIIVVNRGEVVGIDNHKNLLQNCRIYKEIYESQTDLKEVDND